MELLKPVKDTLNFAHCIGELAVWALQDILIAADDNIQELPE